MAVLDRIRMTLEEFRALAETNQRIELIDGELIVAPSPTDEHQDSVGAAYVVLKQIAPGGKAKIAPLDVYLGGDVVQPDVFWIADDNPRCTLREDGYWYGAPDLCVEVVSPTSVNRDHRRKYQLYEQHGVREYWILDPATRSAHIYRLSDGGFVEVGVFTASQTFTSPLLGTQVPTSDLFA